MGSKLKGIWMVFLEAVTHFQNKLVTHIDVLKEERSRYRRKIDGDVQKGPNRIRATRGAGKH